MQHKIRLRTMIGIFMWEKKVLSGRGPILLLKECFFAAIMIGVGIFSLGGES